jgi:hypothetical protein
MIIILVLISVVLVLILMMPIVLLFLRMALLVMLGLLLMLGCFVLVLGFLVLVLGFLMLGRFMLSRLGTPSCYIGLCRSIKFNRCTERRQPIVLQNAILIFSERNILPIPLSFHPLEERVPTRGNDHHLKYIQNSDDSDDEHTEQHQHVDNFILVPELVQSFNENGLS